MIDNNIALRVATPADAPELLKIYAPYVLKTAISFEYEVPGETEFRARIENTLKRYPYIVAHKGGEILGYAYTGAFKTRVAYDHSVETTVYVKEGCTKQGIGKLLYTALEKISAAQNILNMNACIGYPTVDDEHLTKNSVQFHEHMGYELVGRFHACGYKFGHWYDIVWTEKHIGEHSDSPAPVIPFLQLTAETLAKLGVN